MGTCLDERLDCSRPVREYRPVKCTLPIIAPTIHIGTSRNEQLDHPDRASGRSKDEGCASSRVGCVETIGLRVQKNRRTFHLPAQRAQVYRRHPGLAWRSHLAGALVLSEKRLELVGVACECSLHCSAPLR